jgi:protein phosphatase
MPLEVQVSQFPLQTGDRVLVCSDGITRMLDESAIARRLGQTGETTIVLGALIADALAKGGADNATGVLIDIVAD